MNRKFASRLVIFTFVAAALASSFTVARAWFIPTETKVHELAPGVFFRKAQTEPTFTGCNQGWVIFKDYVVVIDANFPNQADEVIKLIRQRTDKPIRFVFDTHYHGDHADGNVRYTEIGATAVASERSRPEFDTKGVDGFERSKETRAEEYGELKYEKPSIYFPHRIVFDDGEQRMELLHFGHAHTMGDAVAWLPKQGILFTGDACVNGAFNYTGDSDTASWITVLNAMEELPVKKIAPGHGELAGKDLIALQRRYFVELRAYVQKAIDGKKTLAEMKAEIDLPFYKEWTGVDAKTREENIEHVHGELTGSKK
ncbi:MAG: MBL fold metallo-hydrolase [Pirellulaceae bacterium]|jgi:glyoxylase-like metal-dependent hydrolase (beta-lactamase superfamily II)|nr:MBL fold metallo-hydrolase [Pirellulaceae bacterium]MDP7018391.1 MBL fold metallo-hydrolase [Pirellulaceae bacterium]